ncbi:hypothetical protein SGRIM128S_09101 [Streptomyces griseomycini]
MPSHAVRRQQHPDPARFLRVPDLRREVLVGGDEGQQPGVGAPGQRRRPVPAAGLAEHPPPLPGAGVPDHDRAPGAARRRGQPAAVRGPGHPAHHGPWVGPVQHPHALPPAGGAGAPDDHAAAGPGREQTAVRGPAGPAHTVLHGQPLRRPAVLLQVVHEQSAGVRTGFGRRPAQRAHRVGGERLSRRAFAEHGAVARVHQPVDALPAVCRQHQDRVGAGQAGRVVPAVRRARHGGPAERLRRVGGVLEEAARTRLAPVPGTVGRPGEDGCDAARSGLRQPRRAQHPRGPLPRAGVDLADGDAHRVGPAAHGGGVPAPVRARHRAGRLPHRHRVRVEPGGEQPAGRQAQLAGAGHPARQPPQGVQARAEDAQSLQRGTGDQQGAVVAERQRVRVVQHGLAQQLPGRSPGPAAAGCRGPRRRSPAPPGSRPPGAARGRARRACPSWCRRAAPTTARRSPWPRTGCPADRGSSTPPPPGPRRATGSPSRRRGAAAARRPTSARPPAAGRRETGPRP